jgi:hypothetical protein
MGQEIGNILLNLSKNYKEMIERRNKQSNGQIKREKYMNEREERKDAYQKERK